MREQGPFDVAAPRFVRVTPARTSVDAQESWLRNVWERVRVLRVVPARPPFSSQWPWENEPEFIYSTQTQKSDQLFVCFKLEHHVGCQSAVKWSAVKIQPVTLDCIYDADSRRLDGHFSVSWNIRALTCSVVTTWMGYLHLDSVPSLSALQQVRALEASNKSIKPVLQISLYFIFYL